MAAGAVWAGCLKATAAASGGGLGALARLGGCKATAAAGDWSGDALALSDGGNVTAAAAGSGGHSLLPYKFMLCNINFMIL